MAGVTDCTRVYHGAPVWRLPPNAYNLAGTARAPFHAAHPRYPSSRAGRAWKPSPTGPPPLTHVAPTPQSRRYAPRQLPFQGSRGMGGGGYLFASASHDADTYVYLLPVRGGVLDAPRLRDCRGEMGADGRRGRLHSRYPRCAHLASTAQRMQYRGHRPRTFFAGAPTSPVIRRLSKFSPARVTLGGRRATYGCGLLFSGALC